VQAAKRNDPIVIHRHASPRPGRKRVPTLAEVGPPSLLMTTAVQAG